MNLINNILLNINFYDEDAHQGDTVWPMMAFLLYLAGIIVTLVGVVNLICEWREFRLFYDASAANEKPAPELKKQRMKKHVVKIIAGILMIIAGTLYLYLF